MEGPQSATMAPLSKVPASNGPTGLCDELLTRSGLYPAYAHMQLGSAPRSHRDPPKRDIALKKKVLYLSAAKVNLPPRLFSNPT